MSVQFISRDVSDNSKPGAGQRRQLFVFSNSAKTSTGRKFIKVHSANIGLDFQVSFQVFTQAMSLFISSSNGLGLGLSQGWIHFRLFFM